MKTIKAINKDGVLYPETPLPEDSLEVRMNGVDYIVYEKGDELPAPIDYGTYKEPETESELREVVGDSIYEKIALIEKAKVPIVEEPIKQDIKII